MPTSEWEIYASKGWFLDPYAYISSPKSIAVPAFPSTQYEWMWLTYLLGLCIPDGIVYTYVWIPEAATNGFVIWFRAQELPAKAAGMQVPANCYYIHSWCNIASLYKVVGGVGTALKGYSYSPNLTSRTWSARVAIIWQTVDIGGTKYLRITWMFSRPPFTAWETAFVYDDSANLWETSSVNRVGLTHAGAYPTPDNLDRRGRFDDTEIYRKTPVAPSKSTSPTRTLTPTRILSATRNLAKTRELDP